MPPIPVTEASGDSATAELDTPVPAQPAILNFDQLPLPPWALIDCTGRGSGRVERGILTINSPSDCHEYSLDDPEGTWNQHVSNSRGWVVEANLKVDPHTQPNCDNNGGSVVVWANDRVNLIIFGFSTNEICISYPEEVHFAMDTTNAFHVYRI